MIKNKKNRRLLKRILALVLAFIIVISFGLYHSQDRVLQAEALPDESAATETVAEQPQEAPAAEAAPVEEEVVEISLPAVSEEAPAEDLSVGTETAAEEAAIDNPASAEGAGEAELVPETGEEAAKAEETEVAAEEAAGAQQAQSLVIVEIKGKQATVVYNGSPQTVSGFSYQARTEADSADVSGAVRVSLSSGQAAVTATEPGTYSMNLQPGMFQAQSDQYARFEIRIARDGRLTIEEAPEKEEEPEETEPKETEKDKKEETISEETGETAEEASAEKETVKEKEEGSEELIAEGEGEGEEEEGLEAEEGEEGEELLELDPLEDEEEEEEEKDRKPERPAQVLRVIASDGAVVTVSAPEGTLPDGAYVTASVVSSDHAREVIDAMLGEEQEVVSVVVYDITIHDRDGNEIQPDGSVQVSISGSSVQDGESGGVYHVSGDGASMVSGLSGKDASFSADHFSEYAVVTTRSVSGDSISSEGLTIEVGESVIITPPNKYSKYTLRWISGKESVATVSSDGMVTGVSQGDATIQLQYASNSWFTTSWKGAANYTIHVVPGTSEPGISLKPKTASMTELGQTVQLTATLEGGINEENTIIWETSDPNVAVVENGLVRSTGAGEATITAKVYPDEDELYGNVYEDTAEVTVELSSYNLYHYALIPGADKDAVIGSSNSRWFGIGVTKINGVPNPSRLSSGMYSGSYQIGDVVKALYPSLSYGGKTFQYAPAGSPQASQSGYYTVQPFRVVVAGGANSGNNGYNPTALGNCYHLDYICVLNEEEFCSANFAVQYPGSTSFDGLTDYASRVTVGSSESRLTLPSASAVPATQKVNGITYRFEGWYRDSACSVLSDFAGTLEGNTTYYGRYVPSDAYYRVEYYYDGVRDDSMTVRSGPAAIGTVVTGFTDKAKTGFTRSGYEPGELTITADESANVIRVYYTKRLLTYSVRYLLYGTQQEIAPSGSMTIKSGELAQARRIAVDGYTPADDEETKSQVITENGQQIVFYYRQNVILTANSLTVPYTGEEQTAEGYTASVAGVVFEEARAAGAGTQAGTYPVRFERDLLGTVDESGRYIVSSCREGVLTIEPVPVTVTAVSTGKIFGAEDPALEAQAQGLKNNDTLVYTVERQPGENAGSYTITVTGEELQGSYQITYLPGTFTITTGAIPLAAVTAERIYDGTPLTGGASANLPEGTQISYSTDGGQSWREEAPFLTDAGTLEYLVRAQNRNYETALAQGSLTVGKRSILLTSADAEKEYDGTPLTTADAPDQGITVSGDGFVTGEGASFEATGSQLIVGESANTFNYTFNAGTKADNYDVQVQEGTLSVTDRTGKYEIVLRAMGGEFMYDGTEKRAEGFEESIFTLNGNTYTVSGVEASASGTAAGTYPMEISGEARVADAAGNDVTPQFEVTAESANLTILKRNLEISSASASKQYDGRPLNTLSQENQGITVSGDGFAAGEGADYEVTGSQTAAGSSLNSFRTVFRQGTDAANYNLTEKPGTLTVVNRDSKYSITVKAVSDSVLYNGQTQTLQGLAQTVFTIDGLDFTVSGLSASGQGLHAGTWPVSVTGTARVTDPEGNDVTDQFAVLTENGTLEIRPRSLVLTSADAAREYDGTPLTEHTVNVSGDGFAAGDSAQYTFSGTQTLQGESPNTFRYEITGAAQDGDYEIEAKYGLLQVRGRGDKFRLTLEGLTGETVYDGQSHELSGFASTEFNVNGQTYRVEGVTAQAAGTHAGTYRTAVTGSPRVMDASGNDVTAQFYVNIEAGTLTITKRSVHLTSATVSKQYDGTPLTADSVSVSEGSFAEGEGAVYTVTGSQTVAGSSPNTFTYTLNGNTLAEDYNISVTEGLLTVTNREAKYEVTVRAASGQALYDGKEYKAEGLVSDTFVIDGLTYSVEGLTASAGGTDAGTYPVPVTGTPVIRDSAGNDVTQQFVVRTESGTMTIKKRLLILTSESAEKVYDGTALTKDQVTVSGDGFADGEGAVFNVTGSQLLTGSSENAFTCTFNENTKKDNYEVRTVNGLLTVTGRPQDARFEITLEAASGEAMYDGAVHTVSGIETLSFEFGGVRYTVEGAAASGSGVDAGTYEIPVTGDLRVMDSNGHDVTDQFRIVTKSGTLTIAKRNVTLTSPTAEQIYNGLTLTAPQIEIGGDGFAEGEGVSFTVTGSRLLTGTSENTFTYRLNEGTKAENYVIRQVLGTLTILGRGALERYEITVTGQSADALYDGASHSAEGVVTDTFNVDGRTYTVTGLGGSRAETDAGTYTVAVTGAPTVRDAQGNDVTDQFNVRTQPGTLTIRPRQVTLTSADAEKEYDGTELTTADAPDQGITVSGDGFAAGEGAAYTVTGSQTLVGVSSNSFTYELNEGTKEENYRITVIPGTLSVTGRTSRIAITAAAVGAEAVYDGSEHTAQGLEQTVFTFNGKQYTLSGLDSSVSAVDAGTYLASVTGTAKVTDEDGNDVTDQFAVSLQSAELRILPAPLTISTGSAQKAYDGTALTAPETEITGLQGRDAIEVHVTGTLTEPGTAENTFEISWGETKPSNYQVSLEPGTLQVSANSAQVVLRAADASKTYDGTELTGSDEVTAEGLPAGFRAEIEVEGSLTDAGTASNHITSYVIYNAAGKDSGAFFTNVQTVDGVLRIDPRKVTISSASAEKVYDGTELTTADLEEAGITVSGDGFAEGEGAEYTVTGTQTLTGMSPNTFSYTLTEGTSAANYEITQSFGTLTVKNRAADDKYQITAEAAGGSFTYDGTAHTVQGLVTDTFTVGGQTYTLEGLTSSRTERNAGTYEIALSGTPVVRDADGNDVTEEFSVGAASGTLTIRPRRVTISSADAEKEYDGTALTTAETENAGITVSGEGFADGEGAAYTVTGSQTIPGESENTFTYRLNAGTDAANYEITTKNGTLKVTGRSEKTAVTIQASGGSYLYDGEEHTVQGLTAEQITVDGVVYTITGITCSETQTDAGTYPVKAEGELKILDADGNDVTDQFAPEIVEGSLQILPRELVLKSADAQKEYDGTALTTAELENTGITISGDGFADGEGFDVKAQGSQLLPGSSVNNIAYEPKSGTKEENYRIRLDEGTLTVTDRVEPVRITVTGNSDDVLYDGKEHSAEGLTGTEFKLNGISYTVEGLEAAVSGTDAGTYTGTISGTAKILDADGNDVTGQFTVTGTAGTLQIRRRSLILTSADAEKVYDGTPLTTADLPDGGITVSGDGFVEGEGAQYSVTGTQMLAGNSANAFTYQLNEGTKAENYDIEVHMGILRVTGRNASDRYEITVTGQSAEALYDGTTHSVEGIVTDTFNVDGRTYTVTGLSASVTGVNAGTYEVKAEGAPTVRDAQGNDVTDQFNVRTQPGTLTIRPREVTLTSADAEKEYDGTELTTAGAPDQGITVSGDGFAAGEGAAYTVTGSQTLVGVSSNSFTYELNEGTEEQNYRITVIPGTLSVTGRTSRIAITASAVGTEAVYDGEEHTAQGLEQTVFTFNGKQYTLSGLDSSVSAVDAGTYLASVTGTAKVTDEDGNDVTDQFAVSLQSAELRILPAPLTISTGSAQKAYDGTALTAPETEITGLQGRDAVEVYVTGTLTEPGTAENTFEISWGETKPSNYQLSLEPGTLQVSANAAQVVLRAADASKTYDGKELTGSDEVTAEGLPAGFRAEIEVEGSLTDTGTASNRITGYVIYNAAGRDSSAFFTNVQTADGVLRIDPRKVTISSASAEKVYDGKELTESEITVSGDGFAEGEGAEYTVTGTQTLTGMSPNTFSYTLTEGTSAANYEITQSFGTLTVKNRAADDKYQITAEAAGGSFTYDGTAHTVQGLVTDTFTVDGQTYTLEGLTSSRTERNAGTYEIALSGTPVVRDADGNDVTEEFSVGAASGTLTIRPRRVTISSADAEKEYDGTALTTAETENAGITVSGEGFADGEGAAYTVTGSQTIPGESENTFTYRLNAGTDAANYEITTKNGTLKVTGRSEKTAVTIQTAGGSAVYDGTGHTVNGLVTDTFTVDGVVYTITGVTCSETQTDAGTYPVKAEGEPKILDADGNDVTDQFAPEIVEGSLQILPRELVLTSADAQKEYDGTALTTADLPDGGITVSGDGFADGEGFDVKAQGRQLLPGSSVNSISYEPKSGTKEENYRIRLDEGTLTVTDRVEPVRITITGNSDDVLYDGKEHSAGGLTQTGFEVNGVRYTVEGVEAAVSGTDAGTYTGTISGTAKILDADGNDVTGQFTVTGTAGTLQIRRRSLILTSADAEKVYDGDVLTTKELENGGITVSGDGFIEGEGAQYTVTGSQTLAGSSDNTFTYQLDEGTKAENYDIEVHMGLLRVTGRGDTQRYEITVTGQSADALYDGTTHSVEGIVTDTFTIEGHTYTVTGLAGSVSGVNAGTYEANVTGAPTVLDALGNDVTDQFNVRTQPVVMTILPREVTLTSADAEKEYDGTALTTAEQENSGITVSGDGFAAGEGAAFTATGSQTLVGVSGNTFTYELNEGTEEQNYRITVIPGTLSVTGRTTRIAITAAAVGAEAVYDGAEHTAQGLEETVFTFNGKQYTLSGLDSSVSAVDAGTYLASVTGTAKVTDEDGNDVTDQFAVSLQSAELRILPAPLTISTGSAEKAYDGTALTAPETEVTGLQGSDRISVLATGTLTEPGSTQNTCEISWGETKPSNYEISLEPGTLQVSANAAQVVLKAADASKTYDGTELTGSDEVTAEGLPAGFRAEIGVEGSLTDAGTASNHIIGYVIYNAAGKDSSAYFTNVQTEDGVLRIDPRKVIISSAGAEKIYDGKELTESEITVSGDGFAEGEGAEYTVTGTQTLTGMSPNTFSYTLTEGTSAANYEITQSFGTLTVKNRAADDKYQITAEAAGGSFTYDGTDHTVQGLVTDTFTVDGQTYTLEGVTCSRTERNAGTYEISLSGTPVVRDADGNDVTEEFSVGAASGTLEILPRKVSIASADAEKEYDGTALTTAEQENAGITVSGEGFADGEGAAYTVTGSQTIPGESENTFTYRLNDGTDAANYEITTQNGTLKVTDRGEKVSVTIQTAGGSAVYDGTSHTVNGLVTDTFTVDGVVYTITGITCSETQTDAGTYPVKAEGELKILDADGNDVTDQFAPEIVEGSLQILPRELVLTSADAQKEYDGTALTTAELENTGITISGDGFAQGEGFDVKAEGSQLLPGSSVNSISYEPQSGTKEENYRIRLEEGTLTVTDRVEPVRITITGNSDDVLYDGKEHSAGGLTQTDFEVNGVRYTVEGIEAAVSGTDAGTYTGTISGTAKILDADGNDVTGQFAVTGAAGTLQIRRRSLILTSADAHKVYDGTVLTTTELDNGGITVSGDGFIEGEGAQYTVTGSQTLTGTSDNTFTYQLNEGTKAENYDIEVRMGRLSITGRGEGEKYEIVAQASDLEAVYDGKLHQASGLVSYEFTIEGTAYTLEGLSAVRNEKNAGTYEVNVTGTPVVKDADGNDVTDQFMVRTKPGKLTIAPRTVILTSADAQKEYDGTPLTTAELENGGITISGDGFAEGEGAQLRVTGSRTLPGTAPNSFRYVLQNGTLAENYVIELQSGALTVLDRQIGYEITLVPKSRTYEYDGKTKRTSGFETLSFEIGGQTYTVSGVGASAESIDAGTYPVNITGKPAVLDANGSDVTDQFAIDIEDGELTIEKQQLTLTSASDSREYDGTPLTNASVRVSGGSFAEGEGAEYDVTGSQTLVGSSQNTFTYSLREGTKEENYAITVLPGTLTIRPRESRYAVTVRAESAEKTYDGQPLSAEGLVTNEVTVDGNVYRIEGLTAQAEAVSAGSYPVAVTGTPVVRDAQGNDVTDQFAVTAEAGELVIHPRTVILTSADEEREFDGTPLTGTTVTVSGDGFAEGEGADFFMNAERVLTGESSNTFTYNLKEGTDENNYRIETVFGKLTVLDRGEKYTAVLQGRSLETVYDGKVQSVEGFISETAVVNGKTYQISGVTQRADGVDAGIYPAEAEGTPVVTDAAGRDVTSQFEVTVKPGRLVIGKRQVLLRSATVQREYDGSELTADTVVVEKDGFAEGEGADYEVTGEQTITGSSRNTFSYTLKENTSADNYDIEVAYGTLSVINRNARYEITVQAQSADALYDGQAHTAEGFDRLNFEFGGKSFEVRGLEAKAEETDAGTYPVRITGTAQVVDDQNRDVTDEFVIRALEGSLTIRQRDVRLTSESAQKEYNGSELKAGKIQVSGDGFASGEGADYEVTGTQTVAGSSRNTFTYQLREGTKQQNYNITVQEGTLTVLNRNALYGITVEGASLTTLYDGKQHTVNGLVSRTFRVEGKTYQVSGLTAEGSGTDAGTYTVAVTGTPAVTDEEGNDVTEQFRVTTKDGQLTIEPREVILTSASDSRIYDGTPLRAERVAVSGDGFAEGEGAVYDVTGSRTVIGTGENTFRYTLTGGAKELNYRILTEFGTLTIITRPDNALFELDVTAPGGTFLYDGKPHSVTGVAGYGSRSSAESEGGALQVTVNGKSYTVSGLEASRTETGAGTYTVNVTGTPVVLDEDGNDVSSQFIIQPHSSELTIQPREVIMTSGSASHAYNGRALTNNEVTVTGDGFAEGEGADYNVTGSRMIVGESENSFTYTLKDGTSSQNYRIRTVFGTLSVTNRDAKYLLSVKANSRESVYDGELQSVSGLEADTFELDGILYRISGLRAEAAAADAGTYEVPVVGTAVVTDADGNDVTDQFMIQAESGTLKIAPRRIVLRSTDVEAEYNGQSVTGGEVRVVEGSFAAGEGAGYVLTGSRILPGVSPNTFRYTLKEGTKAGNYDIVTQEGRITVISRNAPYEIVLQAKGDNVLYDGEEHLVEGFEQTEFDVAGGRYRVEGLTASAAGTAAGIYPVEIAGTALVLDADGNDVTGQFAVRVRGAELTIRGLYELIIRYQDEGGRELAPSFTGRYEAGEAFGPVSSPQIHGYTPNVRSVESGEAGMPEQDVTITVYYRADAPQQGTQPTVVPDGGTEPETPGPGEGTEPGTEPGPETEEPGTQPDTTPGAPTTGGNTPGGTESTPAGSTEGAPAGETAQTAAAPVGPVQPVPEMRAPAGVLNLTETGEPELVEIEDLLVPLAAVPVRHGYWALLNLVAAALAVAIAILLILAGRRRREEDGEETEETEAADGAEAGEDADRAAETGAAAEPEEEEDEETRKKKRLLRLLSAAVAAVSVIVFLLTEDMTNSMRFVDRWTILMVLLLIGQAVIVFLFRRKKDENGPAEEPVQEEEPAAEAEDAEPEKEPEGSEKGEEE